MHLTATLYAEFPEPTTRAHYVDHRRTGAARRDGEREGENGERIPPFEAMGSNRRLSRASLRCQPPPQRHLQRGNTSLIACDEGPRESVVYHAQ